MLESPWDRSPFGPPAPRFTRPTYPSHLQMLADCGWVRRDDVVTVLTAVTADDRQVRHLQDSCTGIGSAAARTSQVTIGQLLDSESDTGWCACLTYPPVPVNLAIPDHLSTVVALLRRLHQVPSASRYLHRDLSAGGELLVRVTQLRAALVEFHRHRHDPDPRVAAWLTAVIGMVHDELAGLLADPAYRNEYASKLLTGVRAATDQPDGPIRYGIPAEQLQALPPPALPAWEVDPVDDEAANDPEATIAALAGPDQPYVWVDVNYALNADLRRTNILAFVTDFDPESPVARLAHAALYGSGSSSILGVVVDAGYTAEEVATAYAVTGHQSRLVAEVIEAMRAAAA